MNGVNISNGTNANEVLSDLDHAFRQSGLKTGELIVGASSSSNGRHHYSLDGNHRVGKLQYATKCDHAQFCWECPPIWANKCQYKD